jgi:hypothetical protein
MQNLNLLEKDKIEKVDLNIPRPKNQNQITFIQDSFLKQVIDNIPVIKSYKEMKNLEENKILKNFCQKGNSNIFDNHNTTSNNLLSKKTARDKKQATSFDPLDLSIQRDYKGDFVKDRRALALEQQKEYYKTISNTTETDSSPIAVNTNITSNVIQKPAEIIKKEPIVKFDDNEKDEDMVPVHLRKKKNINSVEKEVEKFISSNK